MDILKILPISSWQEKFPSATQAELTSCLENGQVLFFPELSFPLTTLELQILSPEYVSETSKNISYNKLTDEVRGLAKNADKEEKIIRYLLSRFADHANDLISTLFPLYTRELIIGRTSLRPVEIEGRESSYRKDDTRLHVDAFPANPNHGMRILRVFTNVNPEGKPRVWRLGEPFELVAQQFLKRLHRPFPGTSSLLHLLKITKKRRSLYDHFMLQLHDNMKADEKYQRDAQQLQFPFPTNSTWIVQTDHVSHAALSGQHVLEQTFYLPVHAMQDQSKSPLKVLEKLFNRRLI